MCNFKFEATSTFDLDAKSSYGKSCLSSANDLVVFPCVARDTWETKKAIKPSSKNLSFNSALLTLRELLNASLYVFIPSPLHGWHSSSYRYTKTNNQQSVISPDEGLTHGKSASLSLHIDKLTLTLFQT